MVHRKRALLVSSWKIARAYWFSEEKWSAWGLLVIVISLNLGIVYILVLLNLWQVRFYEMIQTYNYDGFMSVIGQYGALAFCLVIVRGYQIYGRMLLHIHWRRWMTQRYLNDWLWNRTYYLLTISKGHDMDNPDQRISEDVELFVWLTLRLSLDLLQDIVTVLSFIGILWNLSGVITVSIMGYPLYIYGYLVWAAMIYAAFGTYWTVYMGRPLIKMDFDQQRYEADFRFSLMRLREHGESIAFYKGEREEANLCHGIFNNIIRNYRGIILLRRKLMWLTTGYTQVSAVFASLVAAPRYFSGYFHLGQMFQIVDAYHHVQTGFSFVVDSFTRIAHWRAVVNRLTHFLVSMEMVRLQSERNHQFQYLPRKCKTYSVKEVTVFLPDHLILVQNLSLSLQRSQRLLIMGASGCGKSTLLRTFAGIWPYASGEIIIPEGEKIMFVPQKSYIPIASLRDIFYYPGLNTPISKETLQEMLVMCSLEYLFNKLDEVADWGQILSLGEQQKVAFVRVLLQKPQWLFLDEATSALDEEMEQQMYKHLTNLLSHTGMVSVGHRHTLMAYHDQRLLLDGKGHWKVSEGYER